MKTATLKPLSLALAIAAIYGPNASAQEEQKREIFTPDPVVSVDPQLWELAKKSNTLPVVVILKDQRQHSVAAEIREQYDKEREALAEKVRSLLAEYDPKDSFATKEEELEYARMIEAQMPDKKRDELRTLNKEREALDQKMRREIVERSRKSIGASQEKASAVIESVGGKVRERIAVVNAVSAEIPVDGLKRLAEHDLVAEVVYDAPGEPELSNQISSLGVNSFWSSGYDGGVWDVGVLDSGVEETHSALSGHTFYENYATNGYHGTGVACMYASTHATHRGLAFGLDAILVDNAGEASISMAGADWMIGSAGDDPETINYSWGNGTANGVNWGSMAKYVDSVVNDYDIVWAKSAGNSGAGTTTITQPGENYNAFTVANVYDQNTVSRSDDVIWDTSSRGPTADGRRKPDIAAPGHNTYTCDTGNSWGNLGGTSSAAPKVGAASLLLRDAGHWDPMTMKAVLINSADSWEDNNTDTSADDGPKTGKEWNKTYGWGYMDLWHAHFHRNDYFRTTLYPNGHTNDFRLYKGYAFTGDKATMVWERDVNYNDDSTPTSYRNLSDLDLKLYRESNNSLEDSDITVRNNVHQVAATGAGYKVVKAYAYSSGFDGASYERFALATEENFSAAIGPRFSASLRAPAGVSDNQVFTVTASVANTGDLNAHSVNVTLSLPRGFTLVSGSASQNLGMIADGGSDTASWQVRAPFLWFPVTHTLNLSVSSYSYQETFSSSASRSIIVY